MPLYFFHIHQAAPDFDTVGEELPDCRAAWREARMTAGQMLQDLDARVQPGHIWRMEVTDEFANPLYSININAKREF